MKIEALWLELEAELRAGDGSTWLTRFALPRPTSPLLVAIEGATKCRALLLPLAKAAIPDRREWPDCRGLEVIRLVLAGQAYLGVRLRDATFADVFAALAEDAAPRVAAASSAREAAIALLGRLRRWQKFMAVGAAGLSIESQRGLYGELYVLRTHLVDTLGENVSVEGWHGPRASHQDFQFVSGAIEVKAIVAKRPHRVRIASERQLDNTGTPALFLHAVVFDEREIEAGMTSVGENLPRAVAGVRSRLAVDGLAKELFDDRLLDAGYLEADVGRYESRHFSLRAEYIFRVLPGFPRLLERDLPNGVAEVDYSLDLAACESHAVSAQEMLDSLLGRK